MGWYESFLKKFFHDPIDKPFDIPTHETRAKEYASILGISKIEEVKYADRIASCMERSLIPKDIKQEFNEIRHPLSEEKIEIVCPEIKEIRELIKFALTEIKNKIEEFSLENEKKALFIWRNLIEIVLEKIKNKDFYKYFLLIPADTRVPDHSLWEHLKVTSAINVFENFQNNSLFLLTIGPVQSFISQARKTQDLFISSFFLSYLTFLAMEEVIKEYGPTSIIYPDLYKQPLMDWYLEKEKSISVLNSTSKFLDLPTLSNRFVAIIGTTDKTKIIELVERIKIKLRNKIEEIGNFILKKLKIDLSPEGVKVFEKHISEFPEIYWVCIPWKTENNEDLKIEDLSPFFEEEKINAFRKLWNFAKENGEFPPNIGFMYQLIYTALEKSFASRKNLRNFSQTEETGRKCSVCGEKNVLFFWESENERKFSNYNSPVKNLTQKIDIKYLKDGEGLCGLCFLKRALDIYLEEKVSPQVFKNFSFPSTAEIASADFKEIAIKEAEEEFRKYTKEFLNIGKFLKVKPLPKLIKDFKSRELTNLEAYWFYEENLTEKRI